MTNAQSEHSRPVQISATRAAKNLGGLIEELGEHDVAITRYGRPTAFLVSPAQYARLTGYKDERRSLATEELTDKEYLEWNK